MGWIQQLICNAVAGNNAILSNISVRQQTAALKQSASFLVSLTHKVFSIQVGSDKYLREQCAECCFVFFFNDNVYRLCLSVWETDVSF